MSKLFRTLALTAALVTATSTIGVSAQDKGKKAEDKKAVKKATGSIEVLENKAGRFYFKVLNADGKVLAMSPVGGYAEKADAEKAVQDLKDIVESAKITYPAKKHDDKDEMDEKKDKKESKKEKK